MEGLLYCDTAVRNSTTKIPVKLTLLTALNDVSTMYHSSDTISTAVLIQSDIQSKLLSQFGRGIDVAGVSQSFEL